MPKADLETIAVSESTIHALLEQKRQEALMELCLAEKGVPQLLKLGGLELWQVKRSNQGELEALSRALRKANSSNETK